MTTEPLDKALASLATSALADVMLTAGTVADEAKNVMLASWAASVRDLAGAEAARRQGKKTAEDVTRHITGVLHAASLLTAVEALAALRLLDTTRKRSPATMAVVWPLEALLSRACHQQPNVRVN